MNRYGSGMKTGSIVVLFIGAVALAGCAPSAPAGKPSTDPISTPAPSAVETDPSDPTAWVISESGVGPIAIGGDFAATFGGLPDVWTNDTASCDWTAWWNAEDQSYGMFFARGTESDTAPISEVSVYTATASPIAVPSPVTAEGLGIGATKSAVLDAYPGALEGTAQIGAGTWIMLPSDAEAHVFFEFREGSEAASDVVVTTGSEPSYEVCG